MLTNVGRLHRGQSLTWNCLPSSPPQPHELPVKKRKLENRQVATALALQTSMKEGRILIRRRREEGGHVRSRAQTPKAHESFLPRAEPSRRNHGSGVHRHGQQVSGLLRKDEGQAEGVGKVGRDGNARSGPCSMGNYSRNDVCGNGGERRGICSDDCCPIRGMLAAQRVVRPDGWSAHSSSAGVRRKQLGYPLNSSGRGEGLEYGRVRLKRSVGRSSFSLPRQSLGEVHNKQHVHDDTLEPISNKKCQGFRQMDRGRRCKQYHNLILTRSGERRKMRFGDPVVAGDSAGDELHVAAAPWRAATSTARADQNGSQSRVISESRCRTKLHGVFKQAQRHSKDGRSFLLLGRSDQLVGGQIARLSSPGMVILSEVLSPGF